MYKEGTGGPGHRAKRNSKSRRAAGETRNCPFSVAIETPIPLTVSVDALMSVCLARNSYGLRVSLGWGARNPMGKIVRLIEGPDTQFAKNPERPWTQDF